MENGKVICPDCFGDGKDTCHNPDHGFLQMIGGIVGANESGCPGCGHSGDHKVQKWVNGKYINPPCDSCSGTGEVTKEAYDKFLDEYVSVEDKDYVDEHCLKQTP